MGKDAELTNPWIDPLYIHREELYNKSLLAEWRMRGAWLNSALSWLAEDNALHNAQYYPQ